MKIALVVLSLLFTMAQGLPDPAPEVPRGHGQMGWSPPVPVTMADAQRRYLQFQADLSASEPLSVSEQKVVSRSVDLAAKSVIQRNYWTAIQQLNRIRQMVHHEPTISASRMVMQSIKATSRPLVWRLGSEDPPKVRVSSIYPVAGIPPENVHVQLVVRRQSGETVFESLILPADPLTGIVDCLVTLNLEPNPASPTCYVLAFAAEGHEIEAGVLCASDEHPAVLYSELDRRLEEVRSARPEMSSACELLKGRLGMLRESFFDAVFSPAFGDPLTIAGHLQHEIRQIESGVDPYSHAVGDQWFAIRDGAAAYNLRLHIPKVAKADAQLPLVLVLHGDASDENTLLDSPNISLADLADQLGFMVAAPSTSYIKDNPSALARLIELIRSKHDLDESRIYLVGHDTGGAVALREAVQSPDAIAAVASLAGATTFEKGDVLPPAVLVVATEDGLVFPWITRQATESATASGLSLEVRRVENAGHMTMIDKCLPGVVEWLLTHRLNPTPQQQ